MTKTLIPQPDGILFDLDGVIADVSTSYRKCIVRTAAHFDCEIDIEDIEAAKRLGDANDDWTLTQDLMAEKGIHANLDSVILHFQELYLGTSATAGLCEDESVLIERDLLRQVTDRYPSAIVTGRPREEASSFLIRSRIAGFFQYVVAREDAPPKPSPLGIQLAMGALDLNCPWMIGDTPDDIKAAVAAGIIPIGVVSESAQEANRTALLEAGAAAVISDINDIQTYLK